MDTWGSKRDLKEKHGVPIRSLERWVLLGLVRKSKIGKNRAARSLYSVADVQRVLTDFAAGREPMKAGESC